ncbi:MAG: lysophospholipid acyltransferase family protein [Magnetococcales bacterium]|nr:lysophospholipid acyltransferase family protein [Magnetococcales bacterium]
MAERFSHRLEWWLLRALALWLDRPETGESCRRAMRLANLGRFALRREWAWCQTNLWLTYGPGLSPKERRHLGILAFRNIFMSYVEGLQPEGIQWSGVDGSHHLLEAFRGGSGIILASIHLGGWESGLFHGAGLLNLPMACLYRPANNPLSEQFFQKRRSIYPVEWIPRDDVRTTIRALKQGKILVVMTDINFRNGGVEAPFLGLPALCPPGAGRLALQMDLPLIPVLVFREAPGRNRIQYLPPVALDDLRGGKDAVARATDRLNRIFAPWIHDYAEQYNWLHARWRGRPDGTLWRPRIESWPEMVRERVEPFATVSERIRALLRQ